MLLMSLVRVSEGLKAEGSKAQIICEVHDEMDLLVPADEVMAVASLVKSTMEDVSWLGRWGIHLDVPVLSEVEVGTHWGSLKGL
jgi:DNA polymerase-1